MYKEKNGECKRQEIPIPSFNVNDYESRQSILDTTSNESINIFSSVNVVQIIYWDNP